MGDCSANRLKRAYARRFYRIGLILDPTLGAVQPAHLPMDWDGRRPIDWQARIICSPGSQNLGHPTRLLQAAAYRRDRFRRGGLPDLIDRATSYTSRRGPRGLGARGLKKGTGRREKGIGNRGDAMA